jgi:hypothetical protein
MAITGKQLPLPALAITGKQTQNESTTEYRNQTSQIGASQTLESTKPDRPMRREGEEMISYGSTAEAEGSPSFGMLRWWRQWRL